MLLKIFKRIFGKERCIMCGEDTIHKKGCPTGKIMFSQMDNIDIAIDSEVKQEMKRIAEEYEKCGHILSNGHY